LICIAHHRVRWRPAVEPAVRRSSPL